MRRISGTRVAANILLVLLALGFLFQLVVLAGFIPLEMVWGGRLESAEQGTVMALALSILVLMVLTVLNRSGRLGPTTPIAGRFGIWLLFVLFVLNTAGDLAALDKRLYTSDLGAGAAVPAFGDRGAFNSTLIFRSK